MKILMVSSETVPFSKSGGLADVVGALSKALSSENNDVSIFMPLYSFINKKGFAKKTEFEVPMVSKNEKVSIYEKNIDGVQYLALAHPYFTERDGIYGKNSFSPYPDNAARFLFFTKCVIEYIKKSDEKFDVIHSHDWPSALVPYYVKKNKINAKTVFTIHNLAYQGTFSPYDAILAGDELPKAAFRGYGEDKRFNMLAAGIMLADSITTVSPTYAEEIKTESYGCGLDGILKEKEKNLVGILNGIDYREWNPEEDEFFKSHYSSKNLDGKESLKKEVLKAHGLSQHEDKPLFALISRLAEQKGFNELLLEGDECALERILRRNDSSFIIIGTGDERYVSKLKELDARFDNLSVNILFSTEESHRLEGAADFFLMPSCYEPCGLNQMYSEHYGTLPIATKTGGLNDTIIDLDDKEKGTGFLIEDLTPDNIVFNADRAITLYYKDKEAFTEARKRAMNKDFSWTRSAKEYMDLYKN